MVISTYKNGVHNFIYVLFRRKKKLFFIYLFIYMGCPGQLTRTTTIPHSPLDILQAQEQVRHRGDDRRAHRGSNPGRERNKSHDWPQQLDPQVLLGGREEEPEKALFIFFQVSPSFNTTLMTVYSP